ncbi:hypothetical protein [Pantanalinema sp. GBBB05]|uniref:hypothetical protein n=1 Tax=Pantanalinema sp. GBBB05 TaxID=2604139 RepID=UPI001D9D681F|nr:hypothetical protein [Pantanalinema sp. GBBB05]
MTIPFFMLELNAADYSLLSWVQQAGVSAHSLSVRFQHDSLIVHCQTLEVAMRLWELRSCLQMPGKDLCFQVNGVFYIGATIE